MDARPSTVPCSGYHSAFEVRRLRSAATARVRALLIDQVENDFDNTVLREVSSHVVTSPNQ
jgi:hypothetical protein